MTSIPVAICRLSDNNFKRLYIKKERIFIQFSLHFWNVHETKNILKKKKSILAKLNTKIIASERLVYLSV